MGEFRTEVKTFEVGYRCDECYLPVKYSGQALMSNPPQYVHFCNNESCSEYRVTLNFRVRYPTIIHEAMNA